MELKYCPDCDRDLPRESFRIDLRRRGGRSLRCELCQTARKAWLAGLTNQQVEGDAK